MVLMQNDISLPPAMVKVCVMVLATNERNHILTPIDLFNWAEKNINNTSFLLVSTDEIKNTSLKTNQTNGMP